VPEEIGSFWKRKLAGEPWSDAVALPLAASPSGRRLTASDSVGTRARCAGASPTDDPCPQLPSSTMSRPGSGRDPSFRTTIPDEGGLHVPFPSRSGVNEGLRGSSGLASLRDSGVGAVIRERFHHTNAHTASRVVLCVEGGGMRGIVSGGMLVALADLGLLQYFDCIYGVSAGAVNAAYCLSGQVPEGISIYLDHINDRRFLSFRRGMRGDLIDLDYLTNTVLSERCRLDSVAMLNSRVPVKAAVLDLATGTSTAFALTGTQSDILQVLRAAVTVAGCVRAPHEIRGGWYADAAIVDPVGLGCAERDGYTHAVVLLSRPRSSWPRQHGKLEEWLLSSRLTHWPTTIHSLLASREETYKRWMHHLHLLQVSEDRRLVIVRPAHTARTFETRRTSLERAYRDGYDAARAVATSWLPANGNPLTQPHTSLATSRGRSWAAAQPQLPQDA